MPEPRPPRSSSERGTSDVETPQPAEAPHPSAAVGRALRTFLLAVACAVVVAAGCALLAPGSREVLTRIGDLPVDPQDEQRVTPEVWFAIAMSALAVATTVLWWRRGLWRGPVGLVVATLAAAAQTGVGWLVWRAVVAARAFAPASEVGAAHLKAPVISGPGALVLAGVCAVLAYGALTIVTPRSDLAPIRRSPDA